MKCDYSCSLCETGSNNSNHIQTPHHTQRDMEQRHRHTHIKALCSKYKYTCGLWIHINLIDIYHREIVTFYLQGNVFNTNKTIVVRLSEKWEQIQTWKYSFLLSGSCINSKRFTWCLLLR